MTLKAIFFDLDGTLLDTSLDLASALNRVRARHHLSALNNTSIREQVSNGATALIKLGFPDISEEDLPPLRQQLLDEYLAQIATHTQPFEGIVELIEQIKQNQLAWGIVTNKPWQYTQALMPHFNFSQAPITIICPDHVTQAKPHAAPLLLACQHAACTPRQALYIGDHQRDIDCGKNAGMDTIAVGYGFSQTTTEHTQWQATHTAQHVSDLWPIIQRYLI